MTHIRKIVQSQRLQPLLHFHFHHSFAGLRVAPGATNYLVNVAVLPVGQAGLGRELLLQASQMIHSYIDALLHLLPVQIDEIIHHIGRVQVREYPLLREILFLLVLHVQSLQILYGLSHHGPVVGVVSDEYFELGVFDGLFERLERLQAVLVVLVADDAGLIVYF